MKIISWNVNGLRAVYKRDFLGWFEKTNADIICLQEIKIQKEKLPPDLLTPNGYCSYFNFAEKRGYSGVACYTRKEPVKIEYKLGIERFDKEGRFLRLDYKDFVLLNFYLPHGGRQKENIAYKLEVYIKLIEYLKGLKDKNVVLIGDFNIAHEEIDLARPKQNQKNIMFTLEERKQIDKIIDLGFVDTFREFHKDGSYYTWWPYMANARERNLGWRIDYAFVSKSMSSKLKKGYILKDILGSDHCPVGLDIKI